MFPSNKDSLSGVKAHKPSDETHPMPISSSETNSDSKRITTREVALATNLVDRDKVVDTEWFRRRKTPELVVMMGQIVDELKARLASTTGVIAGSSDMPSFRLGEELRIKDFVRLPKGPKSERDAPFTWHIALISPIEKYEPLGLELNGDIIIGRSMESKLVDLDLTPYNAETMGVSREHALLRLAQTRLMLVDLGSTNGTFCNGERVRLGMPLEVKDDDIVTFGALHFKVRIIKRADEVLEAVGEQAGNQL